MLKLIFVILMILYIWQIFFLLYKIFQITTCIHVLQRFLCSTHISVYSLTGNKHQRYLKKVLRIYPRICKFIPYSSSKLSYSQQDYQNYFSSKNICNELLMKRNFLMQDLLDSFNPITAIKTLIAFPCILLSSIGINTKPSSRKYLNSIGWIITFLLDVYKPEIKNLINYFLSIL